VAFDEAFGSTPVAAALTGRHTHRIRARTRNTLSKSYKTSDARSASSGQLLA